MSSSFRLAFLRLAALALLLTLPFGPTAARAASLSGAEQFVQTNVERGFAILANKSLPDEQRRAEFRQFLLDLTDVRRTALFTLGPARRTASAADQNIFVEAFKNYAIAVYESRLSGFSGQTLKVKGGVERAANDFVVQTELVDPSNRGDKQPIEVDFRMVPDGSGFKVIDVSVVGVWLAIEERDQFTAFLEQHNNNVQTLARHLDELTDQIRKNPQSGPSVPKSGGR